MLEAYWAMLDWKALAAFAGVVGTIASPFLKDWWVHRAAGTASSAQIAESMAQRLERVNNEQFRRVEDERDYFKGRFDEMNEKAAAIERSARAMENWAHFFRHGWAGTATKYGLLSELFERLVKGTLAAESAATISEQVMRNQPLQPRPVPLLRDAANMPPPE